MNPTETKPTPRTDAARIHGIVSLSLECERLETDLSTAQTKLQTEREFVDRALQERKELETSLRLAEAREVEALEEIARLKGEVDKTETARRNWQTVANNRGAELDELKVTHGTALAQLAGLQKRVEELEAMLGKVAERFRMYAFSHYARVRRNVPEATRPAECREWGEMRIR